jgi:putative DNA primase/helicase
MTSTNFRTSGEEVNTPQKFQLISLDDLAKLPPQEWLIKDILPSSGMASIYGKSGSGKTFFMLDLLLAISCKPDWCGNKVKNVPVTYICLESFGGIPKRIQAWEQATQLNRPPNFKVISDSLDIRNRSDVDRLADAINNAGHSSGVIGIDTFNAASPKADENASKDMGEIIQHMKYLEKRTNSLVLFSHHTGKDASRGQRGHSSLHAAITCAIELKRGNKGTWSVTKNKDGDESIVGEFELVKHAVGIDEDGTEITSCAVTFKSVTAINKLLPAGKNQKIIYSYILNTCSTDQTNGGVISLSAAIESSASLLLTTVTNKRKNEAKRIIESLIARGDLTAAENNGITWLSV